MKSIKSELIRFFTLLICLISLVSMFSMFLLLAAEQRQQLRTVDELANNYADHLQSVDENFRRVGLGLSYNDYISSIYGEYEKQTESVQNILNLHNYIQLVNDHNPSIVDIAIVDIGGIGKSYCSGLHQEILDELTAFYDFSDPHNLQRYYYFFPEESSFYGKYFLLVVPLFRKQYPYQFNSKIGTAIIVSNVSPFTKFHPDLSGRYLFTLTTGNGKSILSTSGQEQSSEYELHGQYHIKNMDLELKIYRNRVWMNQYAALIVLLFAFSTVISVGFLLVLLKKMHEEISYPLIYLSDAVNNIKGYPIPKQLGVPDSAIVEISTITGQINSMLGRLEAASRERLDNYARVYEADLRAREAELYALRNQVNPHFLFNTFQCIKGIAAQYHCDEIIEISMCIADIMNYSLNLDKKSTILEEIENIQKYMTIMKYRMGDKFQLILDVDDDSYDIRCPRMILQPFVENGLIHGLKDMSEGGIIRVLTRVSGEELDLEISDNGTGISPEERKKLEETFLSQCQFAVESSNHESKRKSIGLFNVSRRLNLFYGKSTPIHYRPNEGGGSCFSFTIPVSNE